MSTPFEPVRRAGIRTATFAELDPRALYGILRLRVDVFVVEQNCAYPELDGRDVEASTVHVWTFDDDDDLPTAYLRLLHDNDDDNNYDDNDGDGVWRIGRVCTRADARGRGLASDLMMVVLVRAVGRPIVLDAQAHLAQWYARFDFVITGDEFVEDGIAHVPMRRDAHG